MKAEDTVMKVEQVKDIFNGSIPFGSFNLLQTQAEISFKAGIKEVVEHVQECEKRNPAFYSHIQVEKHYWQAQLKEWGVE